ncbi:MAG: MBG domain-containing protein, partial [Candidatus Limnocylindrales bacterium]
PGENSAVLGGTLSFATAATSASPVGTYPVTASGLTSANYAFTYVAANLTVTQASLTITADPASRAYGAANPTFTASYGGFVNGDDPTDLTTPPVLGTTATPSSAVGSYPITVSGATATNYAITSVSGTLTVGTASLTVTADPASRSYGSANSTFTASISGYQGTDSIADLGGTLTCTSGATAASSVGSYPITCSGLTSVNYAINYVAGSLTVGPVTLTVTPDPQSRAYGTANPALTASLTGFVNGDSVAVVGGSASCSTPATPFSSAGAYTITCTLGSLSATNYVFDTTGSGTLTISQAALTIAVDPATKVYGDPNPAFTVTPTGLQNGDTLAGLTGSLVFATAADAASGVGSYPVTASGLSSPNYAITWTAGSLSVTKATVTVTPVNAVVPVGSSIPTSFATDITGFVNGDGPSDLTGAASCSTDAVAGDPAGAYTITCTVGTLASPNYDIVIGGTAIFTIGPVTLHVTVDDATKAYGDLNPIFTVSYVGFVNGDTPAVLGGSLVFSTAATTLSPAGTYPVSASGQTSGSYTFDYQPGSLTVDPASQAITFGSLAGVTYGDPTFDLTASASSGLPVTYTTSGSCSVSGVTVTITGAGSCTITAHQAGDANHAAAPDVPQTLTIAKATPGLAWATPADIVLGTVLSGTQLNAVATVAGTYLYNPAPGTLLPVGTHTLNVTFTPTDGANYNQASTTVDLDVVAAALLAQTIDFPGLSDVTSDSAPITLGATASSGLTVTYTTSGPCTIVGNVLTITGTGTCAVTAHQDGDAIYAAAPPVSVSFDVTAPASPPTPSSIATDREFVSPGGTVVVTATGFLPGSDVEVRILPDGEVLTVTADQDGTIVVSVPIPAGSKVGPLDIQALGIDPNSQVLDLTTTITVLALPSTSTLEPIRSTPVAPIASILLIVMGLLVLMVAAGVQASAGPRRRGRR